MAAVAERTNAGTVGLLDVDTGSWASDLARAVALDSAILPPVAPGGRLPGQRDGVPVHLVAAHDTACAVAASPLEDGAPRAFLSGGTWFLVGIERAHADTSDAARKGELLQRVRRSRRLPVPEEGERLVAPRAVSGRLGRPGGAELVEGAASVPQDTVRLFDVQDPRLLAPEHIEDEVRAAAGLARDAPPAVVARSILESIAAGRRVGDRRAPQRVSDRGTRGGQRGAAASPFVQQLLGERTGVRVIAGATEATALGNAVL